MIHDLIDGHQALRRRGRPGVVHGHRLRDIGHQVAKTIVTLKSDLIGARTGREAHRPVANPTGIDDGRIRNDPGYRIAISVSVDSYEDVFDIDRGGPTKGNQVIVRAKVVRAVEAEQTISAGGSELRQYGASGRTYEGEDCGFGVLDHRETVGEKSGVSGIDQRPYIGRIHPDRRNVPQSAPVVPAESWVLEKQVHDWVRYLEIILAGAG